jgi:hypothetical protein
LHRHRARARGGVVAHPTAIAEHFLTKWYDSRILIQEHVETAAVTATTRTWRAALVICGAWEFHIFQLVAGHRVGHEADGGATRCKARDLRADSLGPLGIKLQDDR